MALPAQLQDELDRLAGQARAGDRRALDELTTLIAPQVHRRCARVLPFTADAEDAAQEALLAIVTGLPGFEGRSRFSTWAYQVATRAALAAYRRMRAQAERSAPAISRETGREPVDPQRVSVLAGARVDLVEALERLRADHPELAETVILRDVAELEYAEIAFELGIAIGTVKSRINNGRTRLRAMLS